MDNGTLVFILVLLFILVVISAVCVNAAAPSPSERNTLPVTTTEPVLINTQVIYDIPLSKELQLFTQEICCEYEVDYELVFAVMQVESNFDEKAYNPISKCVGLMQINPVNIPELCGELPYISSLNNPHDNIVSGIYLLKKSFEPMFDGQVIPTESMALMIYNCGYNRAIELIRQGCYETAYTKKVLEAKANLKIKEKIYYKEVVEIEHYN